MKKMSSSMVWIIVLGLAMISGVLYLNSGGNSTSIAYSEFVEKVNSKSVENVKVKQEGNISIVTGELKGNEKEKYEVTISTRLLDELVSSGKLEKSKIEYVKPESFPMWVQYLPTLLLVVMAVFFIFMFVQQSQSGGAGRGVMSFGKSKAKMATPDKMKTGFKDVAGADEEKDELAEIVDFLKQPKKYVEMGARIPKGILLVGPPGTGKTLLAKAVSGEAGVPFFSISGSDFVEMFVGVGASRVRDLFEKAKENAPCIIFIDEIDAVGRQRGAGLGGGHDEREQTLNQLLVEMDGFSGNEGIIMIAATNRPDILDPALLRPGRFDRQILVGIPDVKGREEILVIHSSNKHLAETVDLKVLARRTPGFTGADLENLMNEAALLSVREGKKVIGMDELEEAITRVIAGPEKKSRVISEEDKKLTAYHEAGHAVVMQHLKHSDPVHEISIIPRGMAGGYTMNLPEKDTSYTSKSKLLDDMVGLLGGRVAEQLVLEDISTGAKNDIDRMSSIARKMVVEYGMSDELGPLSYGNNHGEVFLGRDLGHERNYSEEVAAKIDKEVNKLSFTAYDRAKDILKENLNELHAVATALLERERLSGTEFLKVLHGEELPPLDKAEVKFVKDGNEEVVTGDNVDIKDESVISPIEEEQKVIVEVCEDKVDTIEKVEEDK